MGANGIHSVEGTNGTCKKIGGSLGGFGNEFFPSDRGFGYCPGTPALMENILTFCCSQRVVFAGYSGLFTKRKLEWRIYAKTIQEIVVKIDNLGFS